MRQVLKPKEFTLESGPFRPTLVRTSPYRRHWLPQADQPLSPPSKTNRSNYTNRSTRLKEFQFKSLDRTPSRDSRKQKFSVTSCSFSCKAKARKFTLQVTHVPDSKTKLVTQQAVRRLFVNHQRARLRLITELALKQSAPMPVHEYSHIRATIYAGLVRGQTRASAQKGRGLAIAQKKAKYRAPEIDPQFSPWVSGQVE